MFSFMLMVQANPMIIGAKWTLQDSNLLDGALLMENSLLYLRVCSMESLKILVVIILHIFPFVS